MFALMNCTPHDLLLTANLFDGEVLFWNKKGNLQRPENRQTPDGKALIVVQPSGFRIPCTPVTVGDPLRCCVTFELSDQGAKDVAAIPSVFAQSMGVTMLCICSEISARAVGDALYDSGAGTPIEVGWPVLAECAETAAWPSLGGPYRVRLG